MFHAALTNLGRQLDAGEVVDKGIAEGALETMLQSLDLIRDLNARSGQAPPSDDLQAPAPSRS